MVHFKPKSLIPCCNKADTACWDRQIKAPEWKLCKQSCFLFVIVFVFVCIWYPLLRWALWRLACATTCTAGTSKPPGNSAPEGSSTLARSLHCLHLLGSLVFSCSATHADVFPCTQLCWSWRYFFCRRTLGVLSCATIREDMNWLGLSAAEKGEKWEWDKISDFKTN